MTYVRVYYLGMLVHEADFTNRELAECYLENLKLNGEYQSNGYAIDIDEELEIMDELRFE